MIKNHRKGKIFIILQSSNIIKEHQWDITIYIYIKNHEIIKIKIIKNQKGCHQNQVETYEMQPAETYEMHDISYFMTCLIVCSDLLKVQTSNSSRSQDFLRSHPLPAKPVLALSLRSSWR